MGFVASSLCVVVYYYSKLLEASLAGGKALNSWWCVNFYPQGFPLGWIDLLARNEAEFLHQVKGIRFFGFCILPECLICILIKPSSLIVFWLGHLLKWAIWWTKQKSIQLLPEWKQGQKEKFLIHFKVYSFFRATMFSHISQTSTISENEKLQFFFIFPSVLIWHLFWRFPLLGLLYKTKQTGWPSNSKLFSSNSGE